VRDRLRVGVVPDVDDREFDDREFDDREFDDRAVDDLVDDRVDGADDRVDEGDVDDRRCRVPSSSGSRVDRLRSSVRVSARPSVPSPVFVRPDDRRSAGRRSSSRRPVGRRSERAAVPVSRSSRTPRAAGCTRGAARRDGRGGGVRRLTEPPVRRS
jgi:hypothetical protein